MTDLFDGLIASKTRIRLLVRLFFNPGTRAYLRQLAKEFAVSTNAVREELNQLTGARLLTAEKQGRQVLYRANPRHPLFPELRSMVGKVMGFDQVLDGIIRRLGHLERAYVIDDYAAGRDTGIIDLVLVGDIDPYHLQDLRTKTESYLQRKIRPLILTAAEFRDFEPRLHERPHLLVWQPTQESADENRS